MWIILLDLALLRESLQVSRHDPLLYTTAGMTSSFNDRDEMLEEICEEVRKKSYENDPSPSSSSSSAEISSSFTVTLHCPKSCWTVS